jgi:hypothetical protein
MSRTEDLYQRGAQAFSDKRYPEAVKFAVDALALDANLAAIHYLLGSALFEMGKFAAAESAFSDCLSCHPKYPLVQYAQLHWALAQVRSGTGRPRNKNLRAPASTRMRRVSIIVCSINPEKFARVCVNYHALLRDIPHEIIGIHDAKSLCEGYNRGIQKANGEILVFSHDDIEIVTPDFAFKLLSYLDRFDLIGTAGTTQLMGPAWVYSGWPHIHGQVGFHNSVTGNLIVQYYGVNGPCAGNAQAMDGVFLATRRHVFDHVRFDQANFDGWHLYDVDFTFSAHLAGYRAAVCNDICVIHDSRGDWGEDWQRYAHVFMGKHGDKLPIGANYDHGEPCSIALESSWEWLAMTKVIAEMVEPASHTTGK